MAEIVAVAIENTSLSFDKLFSYVLPEGTKTVQPGCRVLVPFGRGNRLRTGLVFSVAEGDGAKLKTICRVLDEEPVLTETQMALCTYLAEQTFSPLYAVCGLCIPAGLKYKQEVLYKAVGSAGGDKRQNELLALLKKSKKGRSAKALAENGIDERDPALLALLEAGSVVKTGDYVRRLGDAGVKLVRLLARPTDESCRSVLLPEGEETVLPLTEKQRKVVALLAGQNANLKEVCYLAGVTKAVVDRLAEKGVVEYDEIEVYRTPYACDPEQELQELTLNEEQNKAYETLLSCMTRGTPQAALLFGVTGSGKTAVFFQLMRKALAAGKNVLFLVPEIALTPQTIQRLHRYFGSAVAVIHSGLGVGQRMDEWKRIKRGEARIVMGTRSAVFAPLSNIGLIIMDEEQESSYRSEQTPRFHARMAAKFLATRFSALFLMASATPEIESYYAAETGRYTLCTLKTRYNSGPLPKTEIVDMTESEGRGSERLSDLLLEQMEEVLTKKEQVILLCNRRGYQTTVTCPACKQVAQCPNCSISLTYHQANGQLMCHYCGYARPADSPCPVCGGSMMRYSGAGTQKIVEQLQELFPTARILRMDADTTLAKDAHEKGFGAFARGEYDILVGTQMVAKGLDFPNVTLVGVLGADKAVYSGDYQGAQRAFNLITQVVGRSGRGKKTGRAVIQTMDPDTEAVTFACAQDYESFYQSELLVRRLLLYPPFCDLCAVGFLAVEESELIRGGTDYLTLLTEIARSSYADLPIKALGPARAVVYRVAGFYRSRLLLKCRNSKRFRDLIRQTTAAFEAAHPACRVVLDASGELSF